MFRGIESISIGSENASTLADFYKEKVGLELSSEAEMGENGEKVFMFEFKEGAGLNIMDHSEVKGKNSNPQRLLINLEVKDIEEAIKKLDGAGVKKIQDQYHIEGYGWVATYEDPDGNYFQLVQVRDSEE